MTFRLTLLAVAAIAAASVGCGDDAANRDDGDTTAASAAAPAGSTDTSSAVLQAGADGGAVMDSIPVRTPDGKPARFASRSGHLVYRVSGSIVGRREMWFTDWGMRERRVDSTGPAPGAQAPVMHRLLISDPDAFVVIDMAAKKGMRMKNSSDEEYLSSDSGKTFALGEMIFRNSGGRRVGDTVIDGRTAHVLQLDQGGVSTRVYVWQGIILREWIKSPDGMEFVVAIESMEFDRDPPESLFTVPAGVSISEGPPPGQGMPPGGGMPQVRPLGAPQGPPGAMPPGAAPPGAMPPGAMPPGAMPPGGMPRR